ncbi:hypothetical protein D9M69_376730 [compost metagenome]
MAEFGAKVLDLIGTAASNLEMLRCAQLQTLEIVRACQHAVPSERALTAQCFVALIGAFKVAELATQICDSCLIGSLNELGNRALLSCRVLANLRAAYDLHTIDGAPPFQLPVDIKSELFLFRGQQQGLNILGQVGLDCRLPLRISDAYEVAHGGRAQAILYQLVDELLGGIAQRGTSRTCALQGGLKYLKFFRVFFVLSGQ